VETRVSVGNVEAVAKDLLQRLCMALVAFPNEIDIVTQFSGESVTRFAIKCANSDRGRLLGKQGRMIQALRAIAASIGIHSGHQIVLKEVLDSPPTVPAPSKRYRYNPKWPRAEIVGLLEDTLKVVFFCSPSIQVEQLHASAVMVIDIGRGMNQTESLMVAPEIRQVFRVIGIVVGCEIDLDFKVR
jgi:predicted RNA-binding protein YlqC (UPF0109 family)